MTLLPRWLSQLVSSSSRRPARRRRAQPVLEALEDRDLLSFGTPSFIPMSSNPGTVLSADFNNDGFDDLATPSTETVSGLRVFLSDGAGAFNAAAGLPADAPLAPLAAGHFNGDAHLDLLATVGGGRLFLLAGNGAGGFTVGTPFDVFSNDFSSLHGAAAGNVNGDAHLDVVLTGAGANGIQFLLGNGAGGFGRTALAVRDVASAPVFTDLNADGRADVAVIQATGAGTQVAVFPGDGTGGFGTLAGSPFALPAGASTLVAGQLLGDEPLDLAAHVGDRLHYLQGFGSGTAASYIDGGNLPVTDTGIAEVMTVLDFATGYDAVVFATPQGSSFESTLVTFRADSPSSIVREESARFPYFSADLEAGDFNGDGAPDVANASYGGGVFLEPEGVFAFLNDDEPSPPPPGGPTLVSAKLVTFTDVDGDVVSVRSSKPIFDQASLNRVFAFGPPDPGRPGLQLRSIDLNNLTTPAQARKATLTVTAAAHAGGDGRVNVGSVLALVDLAGVTIEGDLGAVVVGDGNTLTTGLKSLDVGSMGALGTSTQGPDGSLTGFILGKLGGLRVRGDVVGVDFRVEGSQPAHGAIGSVTIDGSLIGGATDFSGRIKATGNVGPVLIGGDVRGGDGARSGQLEFLPPLDGSPLTTVSSITVRGSILGGAGNQSGSIRCGGTESIAVGGSFVGEDGRLKSVFGFTGDESGSVQSFGATTQLHLAGDLEGGAGQFAGTVSAQLPQRLRIDGSVLGGAGRFSGSVIAAGPSLTHVTARLSVGGDVRGGTGSRSGVLESTVKVKTLEVGQSVIGGEGRDSGQVDTAHSVNSLRIGGDVRAGNGAGSGRLLNDGNLTSGVKTVFIGGSLISGAGVGGSSVPEAMLLTKGDFGDIVIVGGLVGTAQFAVRIHAGGDAGAAQSIKSLTVLQAVTSAEVTTRNKGVGTVTVLGDWTASSIAVGVERGADGAFGTADDSFEDPPLREPGKSRLGSVVIAGRLFGDAGPRTYAFAAEEVKSIKIGATKLALDPGPHDGLRLIPGTDDVFVYELAPNS